jgi:metallo-beta-lactamase family protein
MHIEFFGAATEVTGSCHILRVGSRTILLDCGLIQGGRSQDARNAEPFPFEARDIDAVVLSHAHIDHCGRLPLLVKRGFRGPIHTQQVSRLIASILLRDGAHLAASRARHSTEYRRSEASGEERSDGQPLYGLQDVERTLPHFVSHPYHDWFDVLPDVKARFLDAGHILGSAVVEIMAAEEGVTRRIVFSGDLGQYASPILRDPESPSTADLVLMESTYGNRRHRDRDRSVKELGELIRDIDASSANIVVPAFAVGRSQELLYHLGTHARDWGLDRWHIFLDSPLAIEASEVYWNHGHLFDAEALGLRKSFTRMPQIPNLHLTRTAAESRIVNQIEGGAIIIAGSGTCSGGRILHHLRAALPHARNHILFTGFQPPGGLGRALIDQAEHVRIHGQRIDVNAQIHTIGGLSAHGDYDDLLRWYKGIQNRPPVCLVHGDLTAMQALQFRMTTEAGARATIPEPGQRITI